MIPAAARRCWPLLVGAALIAAACSPDQGVEVEQAWTIAPATTTADANSGGTEPTDPETTVTTVASEVPSDPVPAEADPDDILVFDLERFDVVVSRRSTTVSDGTVLSDPLPSSEVVSRGFRTATVLSNGSIVASGYEFSNSADGATFGALWRSDDAFDWTRVGRDVGSGPDEQLVPVVVTDADGSAMVSVTSIEFVDGSTSVAYGPASSWSSDDGTAWVSDALIGDSSIHTGTLFDGRLVLAGAADPNTPAFTAAVYAQPAGSEAWTETTLDPNGVPSLVNDLIVVDDSLLAVGGIASTDPAGSTPTTLGDMQLTTGPADIAVWRSVDGLSWDAVATNTFSTVAGPDLAESVATIDGRLYLLASTVVGTQTVLETFRSDDLGNTWSAMELLDANTRASDTRLGTAGLWSIDGALMLVEGRLSPDGQQLFMTVVDPDTGETVTHNLSIELGVDELGDVIDLGEYSLGLGQSDMSDDSAGLQTIEIRRIGPADSGGTSASDA